MASRRVPVFACVVVLAVSSSASAQYWGYGKTPRDGACFYKDANFGGEYFCVDAGRKIDSVPEGMNDKISSIRLYGRADVSVHKDRFQSGKSTRFYNDVRNLKDANWNDTISSFEVHPTRGYNPNLTNSDVDRIVRRAYEDILDRQPDQAGLRLYRSRMIDDGWTEKQVRDALKSSPEYKQSSVKNAQEIVKRAYQSVLKRDPDAAAGAYVNRVLKDGWTQSDVERELRKSPEYRNKR
jgi:Peptidase inhibitor family I36